MESLSPETETLLNKALNDFEKASEDFLKCRAYSNFEMVRITSERLLAVSDKAAEEKRATKEKSAGV